MSQQGRNRKSSSGAKPQQSARSEGASSRAKSTTPSPGNVGSQSAGGAARAVERKRERDQQDQRRRITSIIIGVVGFAVVFLILIILVIRPAEAPFPENLAARYDGLARSRTQEGYPLLGELDAPVKVAEYSSFDCPHCREFHDESINELVQRVRDGKIAFIYVPLSGYGSVPNGQGAAISATCAAEQNQFWEFHDALFDWQGRYSNQAFINNRLVAGVNQLTLDQGEHGACVRNGAAQTILDTASQQARNLLNFGGTPTITINGVVPLNEEQVAYTEVADILAAIDREVERIASGLAESTPEATPDAEATAEATDRLGGEEVTPEASAAAELEAMATVEATAEATPAVGG